MISFASGISICLRDGEYLIFSLWHLPDHSFLKTSDVSVAPYDVGAYRYVSVHAEYLRNMDRSEVFPGGTPFGTRGMLGPAESDASNAPAARHLRLSLSTSGDEFWQFEPVELDVRVSLVSRRASARAAILPDTVDPGYESFTIWITEPDGGRRRYRSPARYCTNAGTVTVSAGRPYERDIPIFGQAGGYTFRKAGIHGIVATFALPSGAILRSNALEVLVKEDRPRQAEFRRSRDVLSRRTTARLLFHKSTRLSGQEIEQVLERSAGLESPDVRAAVRYASGLALLKRQAAHRSLTKVAAEKRRGRDLLKAALDSGRLGPHRESKARGYT